MTAELKIMNIFSKSDVEHGVTLFTEEEINNIDKLIEEKDGKFYIKCQIKNKIKIAKPEEIVRQLWIYKLMKDYGYNKERIDVEKLIYFGSRVEPGAADIVIYHEDLEHYYILFEVKRPKRKDGLEQLKGYCNAEGAPIGVWSNGNEIIRLHREEPNIFVNIPRIPKSSETLRDILTERWNIGWLEENDELKKGKTTLKKILLDLEELVLGNAGVDPFEEIFKLIYAKLYDEWRGINNENYSLEFYVGDRSPDRVMDSLSNLLEGSKRQWSGIFEPTDKIELRKDHLKICVSFLEKIKLFNSNLQIIDEAFEYLIPQVSKKKEGQFFTPRPVIDMMVKMLNPKPNEFVIDPACGSAGFLLHSVMWVAGGNITGKELPQAARNFAQNNIIGIDFAKKAVKISKAINLIIGDGKSHIYRDNSLAPFTWRDETKAGLRPRLLRFPNDNEKDSENQRLFKYFDFDVLMTNPPFAGTVKERPILRFYDLSEKKGRLLKQIGRHILFIERSLQFIKPGGRMGIILPQGLLNNIGSSYIRRYLIEKCNIMAVVGLHYNTFKPHTGTKTSVLLLKKYNDDEIKNIELKKKEIEKRYIKYEDNIMNLFNECDWDKYVEDVEVPDEILNFIGYYFDVSESINDGVELNEESDEENDEEPKDEYKYSINNMVEKLNDINDNIEDLENKLNDVKYNNKYGEIKKDIKQYRKIKNKLIKELRLRTIGGQLYLIINTKKVNNEFKEFWIKNNLFNDINYEIFLALNQEPVKDSSGNYNYIIDENNLFKLNEEGHPIISHDLHQVAEAFWTFGKRHNYNFLGDE